MFAGCPFSNPDSPQVRLLAVPVTARLSLITNSPATRRRLNNGERGSFLDGSDNLPEQKNEQAHAPTTKCRSQSNAAFWGKHLSNGVSSAAA